MNGSSGRSWYWPRVWRTSGKLMPAYSTSIKTCAGPGVGVGTSRTTTPSGPIKSVTTAARMATLLAFLDCWGAEGTW